MFLLLNSGFACAGTYHADFNDTKLSDFSLSVGKSLGKTVILNVPLTGTVTLQSDDLTEDEYYDLLVTVLRSHGYSLISKDKTLTVVSSVKDAARLGNTSGTQASSGNQIITRVIALTHAQAADVSSSIIKMFEGSKDVDITPLASANMLIVTGYADAVGKIVEIAHEADTVPDDQQDNIPLEFAQAKVLAGELTDLIRNNSQQHHIDIAPDVRTNSISIRASAADIEKMKSLIAELDVPDESEATQGEQEGNVIYLQYSRAKDIAELLQKIISKDKESLSSVVADEKVNAVIINAYGDEQEKFREMIRKLDVRRAQVHVEAMIVEIADADGINFGVQWGSKDGSLVQFSNGTQLPLGALAGAAYQAQENKGSTVIDENGNTTVNPDTKGDLSALLGLLSGYNGAAIGVVKGDWMALVQALKNNSHANILSTPSLTTLDNQKASFMVGEEVPVITGSTTGSDNSNPFQTLDRRNVGTKLTINPQINNGNAVQLQISTEVSKIEGNTGVDVIFAERKLDTTVLVDDGSMIVLGGLLDEQEDDSHSSLPILGDIPVIGKLFSSDNRTKQKRNLMIFIRPTILQTPADTAELTKEKYAYIHAQKMFSDTFSAASSSRATASDDGSEIAAFMKVPTHE